MQKISFIWPYAQAIRVLKSTLVRAVASAVKAVRQPGPLFETGDRVNHVQRGIIIRTDGCVLGHTTAGVLVEFHKVGQVTIDPDSLCLIG